MKLKDKIALITGSATGIGRSTALLFSQEGAKVVLADISKEAEETVREIRAAGGSAVFVQGDVSVPSDAQKMVNTVKESYGEINILHNNAGILRICGDLFKTEESDWDRIVDINLKGVFLVSKYAIPPQTPEQSWIQLFDGSLSQTPHSSSTAFPLTSPKQSVQDELFPPHSPHSSYFISKPLLFQFPSQPKTQDEFSPTNIHSLQLSI